MADCQDPPADTSLILLPIKDCLLCAICLDLYKDPRALPCQHVFCNRCLQNSLKVDPKCPKCRVELDVYVSTPEFPVAIEIVGMMDGYKVQPCINLLFNYYILEYVVYDLVSCYSKSVNQS